MAYILLYFNITLDVLLICFYVFNVLYLKFCTKNIICVLAKLLYHVIIRFCSYEIISKLHF